MSVIFFKDINIQKSYFNYEPINIKLHNNFWKICIGLPTNELNFNFLEFEIVF